MAGASHFTALSAMTDFVRPRTTISMRAACAPRARLAVVVVLQPSLPCSALTCNAAVNRVAAVPLPRRRRSR